MLFSIKMTLKRQVIDRRTQTDRHTWLYTYRQIHRQIIQIKLSIIMQTTYVIPNILVVTFKKVKIGQTNFTNILNSAKHIIFSTRNQCLKWQWAVLPFYCTKVFESWCVHSACPTATRGYHSRWQDCRAFPALQKIPLVYTLGWGEFAHRRNRQGNVSLFPQI